MCREAAAAEPEPLAGTGAQPREGKFDGRYGIRGMWSCSSSQRAERESLEPSAEFVMGVGPWWVQDQAGGRCHPCPGVTPGAGTLESHSRHLLLGHRDSGHCHSPAGMFLLSLSAILALGTAGFRHHRASHCNNSQHPGEMELMSLCTSSGMGAEPRPVSRRQNSLQEPPRFLLKLPDPSLCSGTPPWAGCAA